VSDPAHDMSVMWSKPIDTAEIMKAPYSVRFLTMPSTICLPLSLSRVLLLQLRPLLSSELGGTARVARFLLNLMT